MDEVDQIRRHGPSGQVHLTFDFLLLLSRCFSGVLYDGFQSAGEGGVQERQEDLVVADQFDSVRRRAIKHIDPAPVLRLFVNVDCHQAVEVVAEVANHAYRFDENFRQDDRTAQIEPNALLKSGDDGAQSAEVDH